MIIKRGMPELGIKLCEILKLDPRSVSKIVIEIGPLYVTTIEITLLADENLNGKLTGDLVNEILLMDGE